METIITGDEYHEKSVKGELCGIVGCTENPSEVCPTCGGHYCKEHIRIHFHFKRL